MKSIKKTTLFQKATNPKKALKKDSYKMYIRSGRSIKATTIDINRCKKEKINPFSPFPNYLQYLSGIVSLPRIYYIYTKSRPKRNI